jgi:hypothetical protein
MLAYLSYCYEKNKEMLGRPRRVHYWKTSQNSLPGHTNEGLHMGCNRQGLSDRHPARGF